MTTTRADLEITLTPPPAARGPAKAIIAAVEENIQAQVLLLASNDTGYDPDFHGWLNNQGLLAAKGLDEPEGESALAEGYGDKTDLIEGQTESMREKNDSVNDSTFAAFDTTNGTYQSIVEKVDALNEQMAEAPGPEDEDTPHMPIGAEYEIIRAALTTLTEVIDLVDGAQADMEARAGAIERANPGNNGDPSQIWGASSPASNATYEVTGDATVEDILAIARKEMERGVYENGTNRATYSDTGEEAPYNINDAWCAAFTSYVWDKAGYDVSWTNPNYVPSIWNDAKSMGLAAQTGQAQAGDLIIFDWEGDGTPDHIGIVDSVQGNTITTIEGNSGDKLKSNTYDMGNSDVVGVVKPPAEESAAAAS